MIQRKPTFYHILVYLAYGFYLLLGLTWFYFSFMNSSRVNPYAMMIVLIFASQCYFRHLMTNLVLGIITLLGSIYMFLEVLNNAVLAAKINTATSFDIIFVLVSVCSIVLSIVLIFSFMKLNQKHSI